MEPYQSNYVTNKINEEMPQKQKSCNIISMETIPLIYGKAMKLSSPLNMFLFHLIIQTFLQNIAAVK